MESGPVSSAKIVERASCPFYSHVHLAPRSILDAYPVHRQCVEEFVGKDTTYDSLRKRVADFHNAIPQSRRGRQHVVAELAAMAAELDDLKLRRVPQLSAELLELPREDAPEQRADTDAGKVIARLADALTAG